MRKKVADAMPQRLLKCQTWGYNFTGLQVSEKELVEIREQWKLLETNV